MIAPHVKRAIRRGVSYARRSPVGAWLRDEHTPVGAGAAPFVPTGHWITSHGEAVPVIKGLRDRLKPGWRTMAEPAADAQWAMPPAGDPAAFRRSVRAAAEFLHAAGGNLEQARALEVGCYDGGRSFAMAAEFACAVTAADLPEYYVQQQQGSSISPQEIARSAAWLFELRDRTRQAFLRESENAAAVDAVRFVDQDIARLDVEDRPFDLIVSWEVLEHLRSPERCFERMFRLLRPGGLMFHEYNPFFCLEGGHSICTLDIPFGHARLSSSEFEHYVRQERPLEADVDLRFYHMNLNRMTLADLRVGCETAGFSILSIVEWPEIGDAPYIDSTVLDQVRRHYPTATLNDLLVRRVWLAAMRPS